MYLSVSDIPTKVVERFAQAIHGLPSDAGGCITWRGYADRYGYGLVSFRAGRVTGATGAHRLAYLMLVGPIAEGLVIDHLCRNRLCVNVAHLEPVTNAENLRRGKLSGRPRSEYCAIGHPYSGDNLHVQILPSGYVAHVCRKCRYAAKQKYRARNKQALEGTKV